VEKYFTMHKKNARDALDYYKKFLTRMDKVSEFLKVSKVAVVFYLLSNMYHFSNSAYFFLGS
jgi:hypothetical protein